MQEQNFDKNKLINEIVSSSRGNIDKQSLYSAAKGDLSALMNSLDAESKAKLLGALENREKAQEILSSSAARKLLNSLLGGNKNG